MYYIINMYNYCYNYILIVSQMDITPTNIYIYIIQYVISAINGTTEVPVDPVSRTHTDK